MPQQKPFLGIFGRRLFLMMAALSLALGGSLGFLGYWNAQQTITQYAKSRLRRVAQDRARQIEQWFEERKKEITLLTKLPGFVKALENMNLGKGTADDSLSIAFILQIHRQIYVNYGACAVFNSKGKMMVRTEDCPHQPQESPCDEFYLALQTTEAILGQMSVLEQGETGLKLAKSVIDPHGRTIGVLIMLLLPENALFSILTDYTSLGKTGEVYLVGADSTLLTPIRNHIQHQLITYKITTEGALRCLSGVNSVGVYRNFSGEKVVGAYIWLPKMRWALMAEMSAQEAFDPVYKVGLEFLLVLIAGLALVLALTILISRRLTQPLYKLAEASNAVAAGNLNVEIASVGNDEVGQLSRQFDLMVKSLNSSRRLIEQSNRELVQAEKLAAVGRLVASIVHEMRNPLSAVKMNIRILQKKGSSGGLEKEHLNIAAAQTTRLEKMLSELLEYSKPVKPKFIRFDLIQLLNRNLHSHRESMQIKNLVLELDFPKQSLEIVSDPDLLTRIVDNLLTNAVNASHPGKTLKIQVLPADQVTIIIADQGQGMNKNALNRLFEPFFTTREDGIGLGMSNVKKFVDVLGGGIEVQSVENEGTTVILKFNRGPYDTESTNH